VILQEDLASGQRVREYRLEGRVEGSWRPIGAGTAIGHKRIQPVEPAPYEAVRLLVLRSTGVPQIRRLGVYATGAAPPATWNADPGIWAEDEAGRWSGETFEVDLTRRIEAAAQYRLRFVAPGGSAVRVGRLELLVNGAPRAHAVRAEPGRTDRFILAIPGPGQAIVLRGRVSGARTGTLLLRREP
jgi:alpha-L-fucosidase